MKYYYKFVSENEFRVTQASDGGCIDHSIQPENVFPKGVPNFISKSRYGFYTTTETQEQTKEFLNSIGMDEFPNFPLYYSFDEDVLGCDFEAFCVSIGDAGVSDTHISNILKDLYGIDFSGFANECMESIFELETDITINEVVSKLNSFGMIRLDSGTPNQNVGLGENDVVDDEQTSMQSIFESLSKSGTKIYGVGSTGKITLDSDGNTHMTGDFHDITPAINKPKEVNAFTGWIELYKEHKDTPFKRNPYVVAIDDYITEQQMIDEGFLCVESYDKFRPHIADMYRFTEYFGWMVQAFDYIENFGLDIKFTEKH